MTGHKYSVGDKVIFTNVFGICWGVKTITSLERMPTSRDDIDFRVCYHYEGTDTPWCPLGEEHLVRATEDDLISTPEQLQAKYGFTPTEWYGCY